MDAKSWARLWPAAKRVDVPIRQGAWYAVTRTRESGEIDLAVASGQVTVPKHCFEIAEDSPDRFTVIRRRLSDPNPALGSAENLGCAYGVCPNCARRVRLIGRPDRLSCRTCGHEGNVDWSLT